MSKERKKRVLDESPLPKTVEKPVKIHITDHKRAKPTPDPDPIFYGRDPTVVMAWDTLYANLIKRYKTIKNHQQPFLTLIEIVNKDYHP